MDLTKSLKPEIMNSDPKIIQVFYDRARQETDPYRKDYYLNRAIFCNNKMAKQETAKMWQSNVRNKTFAYDSASVFSVGHDQQIAKKCTSSVIRSSDDEGDSEGREMILGKGEMKTNFQSESNFETNRHKSLPFLQIIKKLSECSKSVKLCSAMVILSAGYDEVLPEQLYDSFREEFRALTPFQDANGKIEFQTLMDRFGMTRYEARNAREFVMKQFGKILEK